jgi:predicted component of type VI protein secretion system
MDGFSATLVSLDDAANIRIDAPIMLIGRGPECDVVLNSRKVSRKHCVIALYRDSLIVRDLGSTNGVRVNGHRTEEAKLRDGDELMIANLRYRFKPHSRTRAPGDSASGSRRVSDSALENAEEPIAIPESEFPNVAKSVHSPTPITTPPPVAVNPNGAERSAAGWLVIPEDVPLAPESDLHVQLTPPPQEP